MTITAPRQTTYQPTGDDHLIFQWVKMEGKSQQNVASMFGINQSTVSRIIQRYERWQSHMKDRENGRLDPTERYRAQRWLTYERNELILASCLRIASEMEGFTELSKSTISRPVGTADQREVRTEERVIDRHGVASRFLRLAFRINMEQLKLTEQAAREGEAPAEPLTESELAEEARQAAADAAEIAAARQRVEDEISSRHTPCAVASEDNTAPATAGQPSPSTAYSVPSAPASWSNAVAASDPNPPAPICNPQSAICDSPPTHHSPTHQAPSSLHNLHSENAVEIATTSTDPRSCVLEVRVEKNAPCTCIIDCEKVGRSVPERPAAPTDLPLASTLDQRMVAATP